MNGMSKSDLKSTRTGRWRTHKDRHASESVYTTFAAKPCKKHAWEGKQTQNKSSNDSYIIFQRKSSFELTNFKRKLNNFDLVF